MSTSTCLPSGRCAAVALFAVFTAAAEAQSPGAGAPLPVDAQVITGALPNGVRYYIRQNGRPDDRAELRLVVNAGSIQESDAQRGYAHFVEHMAFNGTRNFARNDLVKYLQSIGVRFGADLNAYTSFDETVYILPIPTDTPRIVDQAFTILEDWAHGQLFVADEVVKERGVVHEEWRSSRGAGERMLREMLPVALRGSRYAERLPIGTEQSIMSATADGVRAFYETWYRPDRMAVVAVGDFDPALIERRIREHFGRIPARTGAAPAVDASVPPNAAPLVSITSDPEATGTVVSVYYKLPRDSMGTVADYRRALAEQLYFTMLNARFSEMSQKPDAAFIGASASRGGFVGRELDPFSLGAAARDGEVLRSLEALLIEARRVQEFGFLPSELERARASLLRAYERMHAERERTESGAYADEYVRAFLESEPIPGIAWEYDIAQRVVPTITIEEMNRLGARWITDSNRVVIIQAPKKDGVALPGVSEVLATFDRAARAPVVAWTDNVSTEALVSNLRPAGRITGSRSLPADVVEWQLSNGARVLVKPTEFKADQVVFGAWSPGGTGLVKDEDFMSAILAPQVSALSGLGAFSRVDLTKKLAGKAAAVSPTLGAMTEGLSGSASPKDLPTLMELIYLTFTAARLDTAAFTAFRQNATPFLANRGAAPDAVFSDTVQVTLGQHHHRARPLTTETFSEVDGGRAIAILHDRFADADDFTFVFVGNVDTTSLRPLVERYLASLPSLPRVDTARAVEPPSPRGVIERVVHKGIEPKARTLIVLSGECDYAPETRVALLALTQVLELRLVETLREKLGGTYSPSVGGGCSRTPHEEYAIQVHFQSAPENVAALSDAVYALMDSLRTVGPTQDDVDRAREQVLRLRETSLRENGYWLSGIMQRTQSGEDIGGLLEPYDNLVRQLTPAALRDAARQYLDMNNRARFILLPEARNTP